MATTAAAKPCSLLRYQCSGRTPSLSLSCFKCSAPAKRTLVLAKPGQLSTSFLTPCTSSLKLQRCSVVVRSSTDDNDGPVMNKEFGYSRKDIILIGAGVLAFGYALYYGLQATGMSAGFAGNWVQLIVFLGVCIGWVSTYIYRVATKQMTYVKQLETYEEAVMRKRVEEMTEAELGQLVGDVEAEKLKNPRKGQ